MNITDLSSADVRKVLFTPCNTKGHFALWIRQFLGIELPNCTVSEESTSNPLDAAWEYYDRILRNDLVGHSRVMTYASRGAFKTLSAAILEVMVLLHTRRNIGHMAAILPQAQKSASYVKDFFLRPVLRDFVVGDNARGIRVVRYVERNTGEVLNEDELKNYLGDKTWFDRLDNYLRIVVCTLQGSQSEHTELLVVDEIDVIPKQNAHAYVLAQNIPDPRDGLLPLTILTSTRKSRIGLVQKEIDKAPESGLKVSHWNLIDITEACPKERHRPELPKTTYYVNDDDIKHSTKEEFEALPEGKKKKWYPVEGFAGCRGCRLFPGCKGRLATEQKSTSPMLKPISFGIEKFQAAPKPEFITTEYLCFAGDTLVLMEDGTMCPIQNVETGMSVVTHTGATAKVLNVQSRYFAGEALSIKHPTKIGWEPTIVTAEHPYFVGGSVFKEAAKLQATHFDKWGGTKKFGDYGSLPREILQGRVCEVDWFKYIENDYVQTDGEWVWSKRYRRPYRAGPAVLKLDQELGWVLGYWMAEGNLNRTRPGSGTGFTGVVFSSDVREKECHRKVEAFAPKWGGKVSGFKMPSKFGYQQRISSSLLPIFLRWACGEYCDQKRLNPLLMKGPPEFLLSVLEGFEAGDGTKRKTSSSELTTTSFSLLSQLFTIAASFGRCPRIRKLKTPPNCKQAYRLWYQTPGYVYKQNRTKFGVTDRYNLYRINNIAKIDFQGPVYNLEVAGDSSYIADGLAVHNCRKPDTSGVIYARLNEELHKKTAAEMYEMMTGEKPRQVVFGKAELIAQLASRGATFYAGMDFGFTHNFALVTVAAFGGICFVLDCFAQAGLELDDKIRDSEFLKTVYGSPVIFGDPETPGDIKTFRRRGFRMKEWDKGPGSIKAGIEIVRSMLWSGDGRQRMFFLRDDPGVEFLFSRMTAYKFTVDATGEPTEDPDKDLDDECDALRYVVMNAFGTKGALRESADAPKTQLPGEPKTLAPHMVPTKPGQQASWLAEAISNATQREGETRVAPTQNIKKGRFQWNG